MAQSQATRFGSLERYEKGGVEVINDNAKNYVFSNVFQVASKAKPYEKIAVGKNIEYVIEAIRGHMTLLPAGAAYQFHAARPGVVLLQTLAGRDTVERWADICQTTPRPQA